MIKIARSAKDYLSASPRRWGKMLIVILVVLVSGWGLLVTGAWSLLRFKKGIDEVTWTNLVFPNRWPQLRQQIGAGYIRQSADSLARGDFSRGFHLLRSGLARLPSHAQGRLELARLYVAARQPDYAKRVLLDGVEHQLSNENYLNLVFTFLIDFQYDSESLALGERLLGDPRAHPSSRPLAAANLAVVHYHRGNFDRAESLIREYQRRPTPQEALLLAKMDFERGFPELARLRLEDLLVSGGATDQAYVLLGEVQHQLGNDRERELTAVARLADSPLSFQPRIELLRLRRETADTVALAREIDLVVSNFGNDQAAMLALADFAANEGLPDLARRVESHFRDRGWPPEAPALLHAESCIATGDNTKGLALLEAAAKQQEWQTRHGPVLDSLQALALFGLNRPDEAQLHLEHLLTRPNLRTEILQTLSNRLAKLGRSEAARDLLERAVHLDPRNQPALTELVRLEAEHRHYDTLPRHVRLLLQMRRPSRTVLAAAASALGSDLNLLHPEQAALLAELRASSTRRASDSP